MSTLKNAFSGFTTSNGEKCNAFALSGSYTLFDNTINKIRKHNLKNKTDKIKASQLDSEEV